MPHNTKSVLFIADTVTQPPIAGNRSRIVSLNEQLKDLGFTTHFLLFPMFRSPWDLDTETSYWRGNLHIHRDRYPFHQRLIRKIIRTASRGKFGNAWQRTSVPAGEAWQIDEWYNPKWSKAVRSVCRDLKPDYVLLSYIHMSAAFQSVNRNAVKILDSHDVFTDRAKLYTDKGIPPRFFYTTKDQESIGLNRADCVLAISETDKIFFDSITETPSVYLPHAVPLHPTDLLTDRHHLGFIGSGNDSNIDGIEWFLEEIWPEVVSAHPTATLRIAGNICDAIKGRLAAQPNVFLLGRVDLLDFYQSVDVIINPLRFGTGQKIKQIEAMSYGLPSICTLEGARGLPDTAKDCYKLAESPSDFVDHIRILFLQPEMRASMKSACLSFVESYNTRIRQTLADVFNTSLESTASRTNP